MPPTRPARSAASRCTASRRSGRCDRSSVRRPPSFIRPAKLAHFIAWILDRCVPRLADHVVCCTPTIRACSQRLGVPAQRLSVVRLGIDLSRLARAQRDGARGRMGVGDEPLIVYAGVLTNSSEPVADIQAYSAHEEQRIARRLSDLGYL